LAHFGKPIGSNRKQLSLAPLTPAQHHAAMQFASGAGARRFAALSSHFINIALDQRGLPDYHLQRTFQVNKTLAQGPAEAAEFLQSAWFLHAIFFYHKQTTQSKTEKSQALVKKFI
jgi:hypothetical protein